jgi:hypothetical protein
MVSIPSHLRRLGVIRGVLGHLECPERGELGGRGLLDRGLSSAVNNHIYGNRLEDAEISLPLLTNIFFDHIGVD